MIFSDPSACLVGQSGMSMIRSRGMLSAVAFVRSLETCSRIVGVRVADAARVAVGLVARTGALVRADDAGC